MADRGIKWVICLLLIPVAAGCAFSKLKDDPAEMGRNVGLSGEIGIQAPAAAPIITLLLSEENAEQSCTISGL